MARNWRPIPGFPDVEVSDDLQFRSVAHTTAYTRPSGTVSYRSFPSKKLKTMWQLKDGYATVFVSSKRRPIGCHVLVCLASHGLPPEGKPFALHRDGDETNFTPDNLYWGDHKDNAEDARHHGTLATGDRHGSRTHPDKFKGGHLGFVARKLTEEQVAEIRAWHTPNHEALGGKALATKFNVDPATIRKVYAGTTYKEF